ncbi:MAG TPA: hypothetical protein VGQ51_03475, partial [Puia sp.]|nr:hypothetical protein [Puia sp.]
IDNDDHVLISSAISENTPRVVKTMTVAEVQSSLQLGQQETALSKDTAVVAPKVYFRMEPTALVLIDGDPVLVRNDRWGLDFVKNTRNVIVQDKDGKFYLYGGGYWYVAPSATGPYVLEGERVSRTLRKIERDLAKAARKSDVPFTESEMMLNHIIVSTVPAVLVQSDGTPKGAPMPYSSLFYVKNSDNAIFYDTVSKHFYVQGGGNWFQGDSLYGDNNWHLISKVDLPAELLVSLSGWEWNGEGPVAGRMAARKDATVNAVMAEQVPQTARVDRTITTSVDYDGEPRFAPIPGTALEYATNTCSIVLKYNDAYYALDNGIWFIASSPLGAWRVSDVRPEGVELIARKYRVYRAKFVFIYQTTPTAVYEGYLPGYEEAPVDGCGMAVAYDQDWSNMAWSYDLDYVFDWGLGFLDGYYRYDPWNYYYGYMVFGGRHPEWRWKAHGPATKGGGGAPGSGSGGVYASRGVGPHGRPPVGAAPGSSSTRVAGSGRSAGLPPHPPGGWGQRTQNIGYSGVVVATPHQPGMPRVSGGPSGNVGGLHGLPSGGNAARVGNTGGQVSRGYSGGGYSGGGRPSGGYSGGGGGAVRSSNSGGGSGGGGHVSSGGGGGGHVSSGGGGGNSGGGGGGHSSPPSGGGASTHH